MILDYNSTKGGVDNLDKVIATYSCQQDSSLALGNFLQHCGCVC